jgi:hypothetical protein
MRVMALVRLRRALDGVTPSFDSIPQQHGESRLGDTETGIARKCAMFLCSVKAGDSFAVVRTAQGLRETVEPVPHT